MIRSFVKPSAGVLVIGMLSMSLHGGVAEARRTHASIGSSLRVDGEQVTDFRFIPPSLGGGTALTWMQAQNNGSWYMPLAFDTVGAKTVVVHGKVASPAAALTCRVDAIDPLGNVVSSSALVPFPVSASFGSITLNLPMAPAGSMGLLICIFRGTMQSFLLGADYNP